MFERKKMGKSEVCPTNEHSVLFTIHIRFEMQCLNTLLISNDEFSLVDGNEVLKSE